MYREQCYCFFVSSIRWRILQERIDHVAIIVRSLEQALLFYRDTLGITPSEIKDVPTEQVRIAFLPLEDLGGAKLN